LKANRWRMNFCFANCVKHYNKVGLKTNFSISGNSFSFSGILTQKREFLITLREFGHEFRENYRHRGIVYEHQGNHIDKVVLLSGISKNIILIVGFI